MKEITKQVNVRNNEINWNNWVKGEETIMNCNAFASYIHLYFSLHSIESMIHLKCNQNDKLCNNVSKHMKHTEK